MDDKRSTRTRLMIGGLAQEKLSRAKVAVFGVGGVGGYAAEALARCGVGHIMIVDNDVVDESNINRQIIALSSTVGRPKVEVMKERILDINDECEVDARKVFFLPETSEDFDLGSFDYVVDAVDTVAAKVELIEKCKEAGTPVISSMGAGNRMDPSLFRVMDISKTEIDPLARVMRKKLREKGIKHVKVVCSLEKPLSTTVKGEGEQASRHAPGSISFVPPAAGLLMASEVVRALDMGI